MKGKMMEKCDFVLSGGGINWCWYSGYVWNADGTAQEVWSDRFHRFNPDQGADNHPDADGTLANSVTRPAWNKRLPDDWNDRAMQNWQKHCDETNMPYDFSGAIITMTIKDGETRKVAVRRD